MTDTATPAPAEPQTPEDFKALYEAEAKKTADLIAQRNFLKPAQRMLEGLDQAARDELIELGRLAGAKDAAGMQAWLEETLEAVTGNDLATLIAARQKAADGGDEAAPALSQEQIEAMIDQRARDLLNAQRNADAGERAVMAEFEQLGYKWNSAPARTILAYAVENNLNVKEAADWYENDTATNRAAKDKAAATAAAQVPGTAPNGTPAATVPDRQEGETDLEYGRRLATARIKNAVTQ